MDLVHKREQRDVLTKLRVKTNPGRPNWDLNFTKLRDQVGGWGTDVLPSLL